MTPTIRISPRAVIRRDDGRYLVLRYHHPAGDWYVFPGGGQHPGETLHETLAREVHEEIGLRPTIGPLAAVRECIASRLPPSDVLPPDFHQLELFFHCTIHGDPTRGPTPDPHQLAPEWHTPAELGQLRFYPQPLLQHLDSPTVTYLGLC